MRQIDVQALADSAPFRPFHARVLIACALIIVFDGYDLAVVGIALPAIMKSMEVDATRAGFMVSAALFGMMFGNILFGTLADRIGRRKVVGICIALFSVFTAAAGFAHDPIGFGIARFLAGVGIGGVMPVVVAQMSEYAPLRIRSTLITLMYSGYSVGGVLAALLGKGLIEAYGWPSVFIAAGAPVILIPLILKGFPESMSFLIRRGRGEALQAIVSQLAPGQRPAAGDRFVLAQAEQPDAVAMGHLFRQGRGFGTAMFWIAFAMCLFMVYGLSSWLAKLMAGAGYSLGSALSFVLVLNVGAIAGAIGGGWLADRWRIKHVLAGMYVVAALAITGLGHPLPTGLLFLLVGLAGATTIGAQIVGLAYAGQFYPAAVRATGIGWALGVGRVGAILAPIVIGVLVGMALPLHQNFLAIALPAVVAAIAIALIDDRRGAAAADGAAALPADAAPRAARS